MVIEHTEGKIHDGHENVRRYHDRHHPHHRRRILKPGDGVDISEVQGSVDFKAASHQAKVVIAKITEGATYTDKMWTRERAREMEAAIDRCAVYHFCRPGNNTPAKEVANVLRAAEKAGIEFIGAHWYDGKGKRDGWRLFVDFETPPFETKWLAAFGAEWEKHTHHLADLYGYGSSLNPVLGALDHFHAIDFAAYVSNWKPYFNGPESKVKFWQFSSTGSCPGVHGVVDQDRYLG